MKSRDVLYGVTAVSSRRSENLRSSFPDLDDFHPREIEDGEHHIRASVQASFGDEVETATPLSNSETDCDLICESRRLGLG